MTHGHKYGVKTSTAMMLAEARAMDAQAALYGHTHIPECIRQEGGMWVLNPGTAGYGGGSAGLMEVEDGEILSCRIITSDNLEEFV
jgi:predicted phosphodiesterase